MIVAMVASVVLVMTTILILYETLRLTSNHLNHVYFEICSLRGVGLALSASI